MLLRLILVGLVTSLSLELPSGRDVSSWAESGRAWANANLVKVELPAVAAVASAGPAIEASSAEADRDFQDVVGAMVAGFEADVADRVDGTRVAAAPEAAPAPAVEVVADDAAALPDGEELAAVAPADAAGEPESVAVVDEAAEVEDDDASSRAGRLADAVRLTREAAEAWAAVIAEPSR